MFAKSSENDWLTLAALTLSIGWLLPNHNNPWTAFHSDAWVGIVLCFVSIVFLATRKVDVVHCTRLAALVLIALALPLIQYALGLLPFFGNAWIAILFLAGFLLALLVGNYSQRLNPHQLGDFLFLSIGVAALVSVGLQLYQWFGFTQSAPPDAIWVYPIEGSRPYANLAQPNQLATLLLWGLLAGLWGRTRGYLRLPLLAIYSALIVLGLVLTQSRTAWLSMSLLTFAIWYWRELWTSREIPWFVSLCAMLFVALSLSIETIASLLLLDPQTDITDRIGGSSVRLAIWTMFANAAFSKPLFGYGWNQLRSAQLDFPFYNPGTYGISWAQSHNLFIDLVLWVGIPLGILFSVALLVWFWHRFRSVATPEQSIIWICVGAIGLHAMVEYPLHYAYFLLPTGLFMGMLDAASHSVPIMVTSRRVLASFLFLVSIGLALTINDYFRIESSHFALQFEQGPLNKNSPKGTPDVIVLTQLRENLRMARFDEQKPPSKDELHWMRTVTRSYPSVANLHKLAFVLAMNGDVEEAKFWLSRTCAIVPKEHCEIAQRAWDERRNKHPDLAEIAWPTP
ncbi:PglL family O-oligosaccharyltransferase [Thauera sp.]|uniref:PglL family O-oligosaccharyltransferase n=1 Tax=Thauera sp. TaxID=1905334 RepID=UPI002A3624E9|nr:Wzy polymerase domain-containing protein [Thauera sp.]MDX9886805.1 Wzy polymerase domain-containing protein [Thauera sp.]